MSIMMKNKGVTQTVIHDGRNTQNSNIEWNANYDGEKANIHLDISTNGKKKEMLIRLDNAVLSKLLQVPSVNQSLESRLEEDFPRQQMFLIQNPIRRRRRMTRRMTKRNRTSRNSGTKRRNSKKTHSSSRRRIRQSSSLIF
jgi:hypothetical protein